MKLHRFYIPHETISGGILAEKNSITITLHSFVHQISTVLKLQPNEKIVIFNGDGTEYLSNIVSYEGKNKVNVKIEEASKNNVLFKKEVYLFFSLIKKDNVEWVLEKGTEVGVSHFIPIVSARSEKKNINIMRAEKILIEASEQCGRNKVPILHPITKLENIFNDFKLQFVVLEKNTPALEIEQTLENTIALLIGPEGGWTPDELALFEKQKATFRSLGPTVLRSETAAIVASSRFC